LLRQQTEYCLLEKYFSKERNTTPGNLINSAKSADDGLVYTFKLDLLEVSRLSFFNYKLILTEFPKNVKVSKYKTDQITFYLSIDKISSKKKKNVNFKISLTFEKRKIQLKLVYLKPTGLPTLNVTRA
jgi:hypothetical protein